MPEPRQIREDLLRSEKPTIIITGRIDPDTYTEVAKSLLFLKAQNSPPLSAVIDSSGGDARIGLNIYDLIRLYEGDTEALCVNTVESMAAVILQGFKKRRCARNASIRIHHISERNVSLDTLRNPKKLKALVVGMEKVQERITTILCDRCHKTVEQVTRECKKDRILTSEEALAFGLVDEVV